LPLTSIISLPILSAAALMVMSEQPRRIFSPSADTAWPDCDA